MSFMASSGSSGAVERSAAWVVALPAHGQTPRINPPPPCRATQPTRRCLITARASGERRGRDELAVLQFRLRVADPSTAHLAQRLPAVSGPRLAAITGVSVETAGYRRTSVRVFGWTRRLAAVRYSPSQSRSSVR
jgi:hypothetical protein